MISRFVQIRKSVQAIPWVGPDSRHAGTSAPQANRKGEGLSPASSLQSTLVCGVLCGEELTKTAQAA
jgi:hypothetical protein